MKRTNAGRKLLPVARMNQKVAYQTLMPLAPDNNFIPQNPMLGQQPNGQNFQRIAPMSKNKDKRSVSRDRNANLSSSKAQNLYQTIQSGQKKLQKRFQTPQRMQVPRNYIQTLLNTKGNLSNKNNLGGGRNGNGNLTLNQEFDSFNLYNNSAYNPTSELNRTQQQKDDPLVTNFTPAYGQPNQINNYNNIKLIFMTQGQAQYSTAQDMYQNCEINPKTMINNNKGNLSKNPSNKEESCYTTSDYNTPLIQNITRNISNFKVQTQMQLNNQNSKNLNNTVRSNSVNKRAQSNFRTSRQQVKKGNSNQAYSNIQVKSQRREITPNPQKKQAFGGISPNIQINSSQVAPFGKHQQQAQSKAKVINISNIHTLTKDLVDLKPEEVKGQKPKQINNIFKKKDIPLIIDDRSSYYDSDREKDFYNPDKMDDFDNIQQRDEEDENMDQQNILWNELGEEDEDIIRPQIIESRLEIQDDFQIQNIDTDTQYSQKERENSHHPRTFVNSQYKLNLSESNEEYTLENKLKQDILPMISKNGLYKKKLQQNEVKAMQKEMRSLKQSNQTYLLQLVSNQDLDNMKHLIHKSIQQRAKGTFTPATNPSDNLYQGIQRNVKHQNEQRQIQNDYSSSCILESNKSTYN